ncbi:hypothetical protein [Sphingomonas sp. S-NIH.Pt1_0416]|uniref:hypothetical protein n=1 Tax=Sphingomonas sp. S-NIH.Pt1_0416 TaxID=1920123 RepID=UPI000F7D7915|nr:hypothetical protein [Sphingomonas sp. S-NIH.Pt1_0416]
MADFRQNRCCERALAQARLQDHTPTHEDIAWLFGISKRWVGELHKRGVLPAGAPLPVLIKRMARYKPDAKRASRKARLTRARATPSGPENG